MPKTKRPAKTIETIRHRKARRKNIPTAEYQGVMAEDDRNPIEVAYKRRNKDLDPQLVWCGKDQQGWSDLVVQAPPLFIQEKVSPQELIEALRQHSKEAQNGSGGAGIQSEFSEEGFKGLSSADAQTEFYQHDANWSNRMILGDSLRVMASLAERERLQGKVQCIYIDPPYGIKFNSNFQWSTTSRDVKDGKAEHITREPEQVKAFRDTWRDGIHSYLTYLRDRLTVSRDLLTESGSVFVQIGDENVHRVRALMDEVFREENFISEIVYVKTSNQTSKFIGNAADILLLYAKSKEHLKYRQLYSHKSFFVDKAYRKVELENGMRRNLTKEESALTTPLPKGARVYRLSGTSSATGSETSREGFEFEGETYRPERSRGWSTSMNGLGKLVLANRLTSLRDTLGYIRYFDDFSVTPANNIWTEFGSSVGDKHYVVQTNPMAIARCILMTTDPGDLVLDPTCGSGTTAYVAEQWGRRWITIDTSRVALALARARIMGARYPYYLLADSRDGQIKEAKLAGKPPPPPPSPQKRPPTTTSARASSTSVSPTSPSSPSPTTPRSMSSGRSSKRGWNRCGQC